VQGADEQACNAEYDCVLSESPGHRQGDAQHRPHGSEHREPHTALVDVGCARQPGVGGPCPPDRGEDEHCAEDSAPGRIASEEARDLGDREDEDEVEEQLERCDLILVLGSAHRSIIRCWASA
jgi:hypothetical protein